MIECSFEGRRNHSLLSNGKYHIHQLDFDIIHKCNLYCRGCNHFSCLVTNEDGLIPVEQVTSDMKRLSEIFEPYKIVILGGEPLLHPNLNDILINARKIFPKTNIWLITNGLLLKNYVKYSSLWNELKIRVAVSDYGLIKNIKEIMQNFLYTRYEDYKPNKKKSFFHYSLDTSCSFDGNKNIKKCESAYCNNIINGRLYHCPLLSNMNWFKKQYPNIKFNLPDELGIDIYRDVTDIIDYIENDGTECCMCNLERKEVTLYEPEVNIKETYPQDWIYDVKESLKSND